MKRDTHIADYFVYFVEFYRGISCLFLYITTTTFAAQAHPVLNKNGLLIDGTGILLSAIHEGTIGKQKKPVWYISFQYIQNRMEASSHISQLQ